MKVISLLALLLTSTITSLEYTGHELVLNDAKTTIDGETVSSTPKNGVIYYLVPLMGNFLSQLQEKLI